MDTMEVKDCENRHFAACRAIGEIAKTADRQIQNFSSKKVYNAIQWKPQVLLLSTC